MSHRSAGCAAAPERQLRRQAARKNLIQALKDMAKIERARSMQEKAQGYWTVDTRRGTFSIRPLHDGWCPFFEDERLGWYHSPASALDDLIGGHTDWPSAGFDPSEIGLPEELSEWNFVRAG
jgi:hypothetical protein